MHTSQRAILEQIVGHGVWLARHHGGTHRRALASLVDQLVALAQRSRPAKRGLRRFGRRKRT
jgi:hypothetical protein